MAKPIRTLILEDQPKDAELVLKELRHAGFEPEWTRVDSEPAYLRSLGPDWDVILSDYEMPQFDAMLALELLKQRGLDIPFIIVSGTIGEDVAVQAMQAGATDYLLKDRLTRLAPAIGRALEQKRLREEKRAAQQALLASEELFRKLSESSPLGILLLDDNGHCTYCNPRARDIFGTTLVESAGRGWARLVEPSDRESVIEEWRAALGEEREFSCVFRLLFPQANLRWVHARSCPMSGEEGRPKGHVATIEDITDRKLLEAQFIEAQKMEVVGHLAGGVAHDFNNVLAVFMGYCELMRSKLAADDPLRKFAEEMKHAADRGVGLTRQLLAFSRKQTLQPIVLDLNETVTGMDKMLRRLTGENIELSVVEQESLGRIKADPGYVGQVLMNLVVNARDAMPEGGKLTIETDNVTLDANYAATHPDATPGDYIMLAVSDIGTGMTDEVKAHLFEAFFTTKPKGKGTGLGLATCRTIVKQSGGHIGVYSELGKGTTFKVYFPRVDQPLQAAARAMYEDAPLPRGTETLLVVEDDPAVRHLARGILQGLGYEVLTATNGQDGLRVAREHRGEPIGLVVTDVIMPQMSGKVMAEWLKATYRDIKILFTSGYTDDAIAQHGVLEPGVAFLSKPYTPATLARKVREMLDAS